jgi:hypothetical protein
VCAALVYLPFDHGHLTGSDEYGVYASTEALVEHGDLAVGPGLHLFAGRDGRFYSIFAPGQSILAGPFYLVGAWVEEHVPADALRRQVAMPGRRDRWRGRVAGSLQGPAAVAAAQVRTSTDGPSPPTTSTWTRTSGVTRISCRPSIAR